MRMHYPVIWYLSWNKMEIRNFILVPGGFYVVPGMNSMCMISGNMVKNAHIHCFKNKEVRMIRACLMDKLRHK